ncbi:adenosine 5'-monophosphoramidase HINT3-like [Rhodnius prolixus]|uniref:Adenosine 5'-monophosphoramidase HINT3 n=2 Tax=Rhodnius TaxID=13248 RepID=R4G313_RHOPR
MGSSNGNCTFCVIIRENSGNKITFEDEHVVVFPDIKPASSSHYLVVPKNHILDVKQLDPSHLDLLQHMMSIGKNVLEDKQCEASEMRFGFHWPPFRTVPHLHLHAIAPVSQMNFLSRMMFKENSWWFVSPEYVVSRLEGMKSNVQCN